MNWINKIKNLSKKKKIFFSITFLIVFLSIIIPSLYWHLAKFDKYDLEYTFVYADDLNFPLWDGMPIENIAWEIWESGVLIESGITDITGTISFIATIDLDYTLEVDYFGVSQIFINNEFEPITQVLSRKYSNFEFYLDGELLGDGILIDLLYFNTTLDEFVFIKTITTSYNEGYHKLEGLIAGIYTFNYGNYPTTDTHLVKIDMNALIDTIVFKSTNFNRDGILLLYSNCFTEREI